MQSYINKYKKKNLVDDSGRISWTSPSNIALVKYWGKFGNQLPSNPSVSFTLNNAKTTMDFSWSPKDIVNDDIEIHFYFEGKKNDLFESKIKKYLEKNIEFFPFLKFLIVEIESSNTFPHSAGIASSASSMSALALGLCTIENEAFQLNIEESVLREKASFLARLASGSACRSIYGGIVSWGESSHSKVNSTNELPAIVNDLHKDFLDYQDSILIVDKAEKPVSSRAGHALMNDHPFAKVRFENANSNLSKLIDTMTSGDLDKFCEIVESDALELHGLMMNSNPSFILMRPNTLSVIEKIREFRQRTSLPVCFTLDAGPNVHILYPNKIKEEVLKFIDTELISFCENGKVIHDHVGQGPERYL
jgi:diphosphomevalonate decarboxylase